MWARRPCYRCLHAVSRLSSGLQPCGMMVWWCDICRSQITLISPKLEGNPSSTLHTKNTESRIQMKECMVMTLMVLSRWLNQIAWDFTVQPFWCVIPVRLGWDPEGHAQPGAVCLRAVTHTPPEYMKHCLFYISARLCVTSYPDSRTALFRSVPSRMTSRSP